MGRWACSRAGNPHAPPLSHTEFTEFGIKIWLLYHDTWPAVTTARTQEYRKRYLSSGLKSKLFFRTTLLINPEQPGRLNGLFTSIQNLGSISQEKEAENKVYSTG